MSFVSVVADSDFITIVTDGRAKREGVIIDEHTEKMQLLRHDLCIAYTGVKECCEDVINESLGFIQDNYDLFSIAKYLYKKVNDEKYGDSKISMILAGINKEGYNQVINIAKGEPLNIDNSILDKKGNLKISTSSTDDIFKSEEYTYAYNEFKKDLRNMRSIEDVVHAQAKLNNTISTFDSSVNINVKVCSILNEK